MCCGSWGRKESDTTERLNWTELNWIVLSPVQNLNPWKMTSFFCLFLTYKLYIIHEDLHMITCLQMCLIRMHYLSDFWLFIRVVQAWAQTNPHLSQNCFLPESNSSNQGFNLKRWTVSVMRQPLIFLLDCLFISSLRFSFILLQKH